MHNRLYTYFFILQFCTVLTHLNNIVKFLQLPQRSYIAVKSNYRCMYKLNLIAIVSIVAAVSFVVGMSAPAALAQHNMTMTMDDNMTSMGGMTGGDNAT